MAFTETQRSKLRAYLGYADRWLDYAGGIEWALDLAGDDGYIQEEIEDILSDLAIIDAALMSGISVAGIKSAGQGDVEFYQSGKIRDLRKTGNWLINVLSIKLGVECPRKYYPSEISMPSGYVNGFI